MGWKNAPDPPDYVGAAKAEAEASKDLTAQQTWANRPTQVTPWGIQQYSATPTWDPVSGQYVNQWQQQTILNPELQAALDAQFGLQRGRSELGEALMGRAYNEFGTPMDWGDLSPWGDIPAESAEQRQRAEDALYSRAASRLDPQWQQSEEQMRNRLVAQGLRPGDKAWDTQMENFNRAKTDAYQTAIDQSIIGGGQEASRSFGIDKDITGIMDSRRIAELSEAMQRRGFSLNEINALISGQQVGMPSMPGVSQSGRAQTPQYLNAANMGYQGALDQYSTQQAGLNSLMSGIGSMALAFSDRRLKTNIKKIGNVKGVNIYSYDYLWGEPAIGVMADEVPHATVEHPSGYLMVDYSKVF